MAKCNNPSNNKKGSIPNFDCQDSAGVICDAVAAYRMAGIEPTDISIADNSFSTAEHTTVATHNGKRQLYRKLRDNAQLQQSYSGFSSFVQQETQSNVGQLDSAQTLQHQALALALADLQQCQQLQTQCSLLMDSIYRLDSLLQQHDSALYAQRVYLAEQLENLLQANLPAQQNRALSLAQAVAIAEQHNAALPVVDLHEQIEQAANALYTQAIAAGNTALSTADINVLRYLAQQCPQEGGAGVYRARAILALVENSSMLTPDCNDPAMRTLPNAPGAEPTNTPTVAEKGIVLYPNPAADYLQISSVAVLPANSTIEILDVLGRIVRSEILTNDTYSTRIDLRNLQAGWYILRLKNGVDTESHSFIIAK